MLTIEALAEFTSVAFDPSSSHKQINAALTALESVGLWDDDLTSDVENLFLDAQSAAFGRDRNLLDRKTLEFAKAVREWQSPGGRERIAAGESSGDDALTTAEKIFAESTPGDVQVFAVADFLSDGPMNRDSWRAGENHVPAIQRQRGWHEELRGLSRAYSTWLPKSPITAQLFREALAAPIENLKSEYVEYLKDQLDGVLREHRGTGFPSRELGVR